jgi:hypothetical protein
MENSPFSMTDFISADWDMFLVAVQIMLSNVEQNGRVSTSDVFIKNVALCLHY